MHGDQQDQDDQDGTVKHAQLFDGSDDAQHATPTGRGEPNVSVPRFATAQILGTHRRRVSSRGERVAGGASRLRCGHGGSACRLHGLAGLGEIGERSCLDGRLGHVRSGETGRSCSRRCGSSNARGASCVAAAARACCSAAWPAWCSCSSSWTAASATTWVGSRPLRSCSSCRIRWAAWSKIVGFAGPAVGVAPAVGLLPHVGDLSRACASPPRVVEHRP